MIIGLLPILPASITAYAANYCGNSIKWSLSGSTLTLTGYGDMFDYPTADSVPWWELRKDIRYITFNNTGIGITSIGKYTFHSCSNLMDFSLPDSVKKIGDSAFAYCKALTKVPSGDGLKNVTSLGSGAFTGCVGIKEAVIPPSLTKVPSFVYSECTGLVRVVIPENVKTIDGGAFRFCSSLKEVVLNTGITLINNYAFANCSSLNTVYISSPLSIRDNVFDGCSPNAVFYIGVPENTFKKNSRISSDNTGYYSSQQIYLSVTLHPNGGKGGVFGESGEPYELTEMENNAFIISSSYTPTREGYAFKSWNTKRDGSGKTYKPGDSYTDKTPLILYAQWKELSVKRLSGSSRNGTAVAISNEVEKSLFECNAVVLANGWNFADALAGGPLAHALRAPILLITGDDNDTETYAEIKRLGVKNVYILGGTGAISKSVEDKLKNDGYSVERIAGDNRFETAVKIAEKLDVFFSGHSYFAFYAYSHNYPDALSVSGIAALKTAPILYIGSDGVLDPATKAYINECKFRDNYIVGGTGAISSAAEGNILSAGAKNVERICGSTRYETCLEINKKFAERFHGDTFCVSTGTNFPDALAGGVLAACKIAPMLLVAPDEPLSAEQKSYIKNNPKNNVIIFGGKVAIPEAIENELNTLVP